VSAPPSLIAGRYRLAESIGRGGMGEVFAALDERSGARVAVKLLHRANAPRTGVARLLREAELLGRV
jgi:serine/threonine-protein kinase